MNRAEIVGAPTLEKVELRRATLRASSHQKCVSARRWWLIASTSMHGTTLNDWLKKAERDSGKAGLTSDMAGRLKALERENRELRQANEILRKATAYFA